MPKIDQGVIAHFKLDLPPFAEQQRIVAKVEELLARVNAARVRLAKVPAILKRFRQSVLDAASSGRLTEDWRSARTLERWRTLRVEEVLNEPMANGRSVPDAKVGFPVLRLTAIRKGTVDLAERKIGAWSAEQAARFLVRGGDFLVARGNGSLSLVGRGALVAAKPDAVAFPDTLIRIRPRPTVVDPSYLRLVWDSSIVRQQIEAAAHTTAGIHKVSQQDLAIVELPVAPLEEQQEIVARVGALIRLSDAVEGRVAAATARAEKITQAILANAFRGELVPTEAQLAGEEDRDYEPASVLLERIRKDREAASLGDEERKRPSRTVKGKPAARSSHAR